jgi:uncharacterized protein YndB with AHSA1/START domain
MNDYGTVIEAGTVRFERLLPGPIERVWAYLTDSEKRGRWLASGPMELRPGGRVELRFVHASLSPEAEEVPEKYRDCADGAGFAAKVTRCEPPRLLSHTWGSSGDSEVTFELTPRDGEVLLVLTHRRLERGEMISVAGGWHTHLCILADHLEGRTPKPFWATHARLEGEYEKRIGST